MPVTWHNQTGTTVFVMFPALSRIGSDADRRWPWLARSWGRLMEATVLDISRLGVFSILLNSLLTFKVMQGFLIDLSWKTGVSAARIILDSVGHSTFYICCNSLKIIHLGSNLSKQSLFLGKSIKWSSINQHSAHRKPWDKLDTFPPDAVPTEEFKI